MGRSHLERAREVLARAKKNTRILNPHTNGNGKVREERIPGIPLYPVPAEPIEAAKKCESISEGRDRRLPPGYVTGVLSLQEAIGEIAASSKIGLDLETTGLRWWKDRIRLVSITTESGKTWVIDAFEVEISALFEALKDVEIVAHNALFDVSFLKRAGFEPGRFVCTRILSQILWAGKLKKGSDKNVDHDLAAVARRALGEKLDKTAQYADWSGKITPAMLEYAARDSAILLPLYDALKQRLTEAGLDRIVELERRFLEVVAHISENGLPVDKAKWAAYIEAVEAENTQLRAQMDVYATGFLPEKFASANRKNKNVPEERKDKVNWQSGEQVGWVFSSNGVKLDKTDKGRPRTDRDALARIDHPLAALVSRFNQIKNLPSTFGKAISERYAEGRIYAEWNQCEAGTGRMSCSNPPMQGAPRGGELRKAVVAPNGYRLVGGDLSQIEVRVLASLSEDPVAREAYVKGLDIYREVARKVLGRADVSDDERQICKAIVLGNMYGQGIEGMRRRIELRLGRPFPLSEAEAYWRGFFDEFPAIKAWRERLEAEFERGSRQTRTRLGRRRLDVNNKRQRWNAPIQGLACDCLKSIAIEVYERRGEIPGLEIVGLIHDEVLCLVPEEHADRAKGWLTDIMGEIGDAVVNGDLLPEKRVPINADTHVCTNWGEKE